MPHEFWVWMEKLIEPQTLVGIGVFVGVVAGHLRNARKIDENIKVTVQTKEDIYQKVESATKEVVDQSKAAVTVANRVATKAQDSVVTSEERIASVIEKVDQLARKTDAGADAHETGKAIGLMEGTKLRVEDHSNRIALMEQRMDTAAKDNSTRFESLESKTDRIIELLQQDIAKDREQNHAPRV